MIRLLVLITGTDYVSYQHLVGSHAIAYGGPRGSESSPSSFRSGVLRLPEADPLLGNSRYILRSHVEFQVIRPTDFDDFDPEPPSSNRPADSDLAGGLNTMTRFADGDLAGGGRSR